jgi:sterol desaturase/sphingolipid hydroxylase (fatty acid hydroxylase superfamily)
VQRRKGSDAEKRAGAEMDFATDPERLKGVLYWAGVAMFLGIELRASYRVATVSKWRRWLANVPLALMNGAIYHLLYFGALAALFASTEANRLGLLHAFELPFWLRVVLGILLLDFMIYLWHLLNHVVPLLWRFHRVHHSDMNMDVSTANRFHLGEFLVSGLVRLAAVFTFGIPFFAYFLFEALANFAILFHHSSLRVNGTFDRLWMLLFVPPSLHRIHHSVKIRERDSNYGVLFSIWDRMLGTLTPRADQESIVIGIGSHRDVQKLGFRHLLAMPFTKGTK